MSVAVAIEVKDRRAGAEHRTKRGEVDGVDGAVAVGIAEKAEDIGRCRRGRRRSTGSARSPRPGMRRSPT